MSHDFSSLGLDARILRTLTELGYDTPTPIQAAAIPVLLTGVDLLGQAATGTGKTAAFALPLVQAVAVRAQRSRKPAGLVLVPTRELAIQVADAVQRYGAEIGVRVLAIYGGQSYEPQVRALKSGVDVVVATPGRALDHLRNGMLKLDGVSLAVLDEADEMLDMGFLEDIESILDATPDGRQLALFSATMPPRVATVAARHMTDPTKIRIAPPKMSDDDPANCVRQTAYIVPRAQKVAALGRLLDLESNVAGIIFCRTRFEVDELTSKMGARGYRVEPLHGGMSQPQRERVVKKLRADGTDLVIATDVAARGLDIERLTHVINFDVPAAPDAYLHRIGRIGRAGRGGVAITLAEPREQRHLRNFERATGRKIDVVPLPTVAALQAHKLEQTRVALRELLAEGKLERYRGIVADLASEFDPLDIALAALKLAHGQEPDAPKEDVRSDQPMLRIFVGAGRNVGIRPQDLVGAITGEAQIEGREIGAIRIAETHALVELRADKVDKVVTALRRAKIKGQFVVVRPDTEPRAPQSARGAPPDRRAASGPKAYG